MDNKIPVYTVLAVVLGVLLTSVVPATLTPKQEPLFMAGTDAETPAVKAPVEEETLGSRVDEVNSEASICDIRPDPRDQVSQYSILVVDLIVALGVYVVARRRFT